MNYGVGIDAVDIARFSRWNLYAHRQLAKVFSVDEITYALSDPSKAAQRLASRFASKEAFYKALCSTFDQQNFSFFSICKATDVRPTPDGAPVLAVNWRALNLTACTVKISITHTNSTAIAIVIIFQQTA